MTGSKEPLLKTDTGSQHQHDLEGSSGSSPSRRSTRSVLDEYFRRILPASILIIMLWSLVHSAFVHRHHWCPGKNIQSEGRLVPFEAHIMSKCPDAKDCLEMLVVPSMVEVSDKVNFTLSYIGSIDPDSDAVSCMHGPGECLGNIIQLCAAKRHPDPKIYLGFANCMTSDYKEIPDRALVEECALEFGVDFQKLNACISDEGEGIDLLRASIERSRENNVTKSCTVRLDGKIRCIRDGGKWSDCEGGSNVTDLVADIKDLYDDLN